VSINPIGKPSGAGEMACDRRRTAVRSVFGILTGCLLLFLPASARELAWRHYEYRSGSLVAIAGSGWTCWSPSDSPDPGTIEVPETWQVTGHAFADITGDGHAEWVLLVWRPWQDWPIQDWVSASSPIAEFHDFLGESCHVILLEHETGRAIWAGSALPRPLLDLVVGDVDGDGLNELVTLEGDYAEGREGRASHVDIWKWNGFGFSLSNRSPEGWFTRVCLTDLDNSGILAVVVR